MKRPQQELAESKLQLAALQAVLGGKIYGEAKMTWPITNFTAAKAIEKASLLAT